MTTGTQIEFETDAELHFFGRSDAHAPPEVGSLAPTTADAEESLGLNAEQLADAVQFGARRAKLRRHVLVTLGAAVSLLLTGLLVQSSSLAERHRHAIVSSVPQGVAPQVAAATPGGSAAPGVADEADVIGDQLIVATADSAAAPEVDAPRAAVPEAESAAPAASTKAATIPPAAPSDGATPVTSTAGDAATLIRKARLLLNVGKSREGVAAAREALTQSPLEAEPYILLGAGLQDLGQYVEARTVFRDCLRLAKRGDLATCRYFSR